MTRKNVAMTKEMPNILFGSRLGFVPEHKGKTVTSTNAHEKHLVCCDVAVDCGKLIRGENLFILIHRTILR